PPTLGNSPRSAPRRLAHLTSLTHSRPRRRSRLTDPANPARNARRAVVVGPTQPQLKSSSDSPPATVAATPHSAPTYEQFTHSLGADVVALGVVPETHYH